MGPMGPMGMGMPGMPGATGPMGPQGPAGNDGLDGATGPMGPQGPAGNDGLDGAVGATGLTGPQGPQGPQGATGPMGPMGPMGMGMPGMPGATGPMGPQGPAGNDGLDGATGPMGPQGPAGNDGLDGAVGATGLTGPQGPQGPQGIQGPAGTNGATGLTGSGYGGTSSSPKTLGTGPGKSYNTQAGMAYIAGDRIRLVDQTTITNYVEGTIVSYVGTTIVANIDVAIGALGSAVNSWNISLAGIPGATGAVGPQGPQGPAGPIGGTGATGAVGPQGPAGLLSSGTAIGNTSYWNGTTWVLNSNSIYNNGTNVGIGTNVPAAKLDVNGNAKVAGSLDVSTTTGALILPRMTTAQRNLLTAVAGMMIFNTDVTKFQGYAYSPSTTITDQSQMAGASGTGLAFAGQSFTAGATGIFQSLSVSVYVVTTPGSYTLNIHNGVGTGGAVLSTQTVTVNSSGMLNFVLGTPVNVTAGNQYTFNFIAIGGANAGAITSSGNVYPGGYMLNMGAGGGYDTLFQTFVTLPATGGWVDLH
jgi:hypothetical protein